MNGSPGRGPASLQRARALVAAAACVWAALAAACADVPPRTGGEGVYVLRGGDLVAANGSLVVTDSLPGDVMAAGGELDFSGSIGGDFLGAGGDQDLRGTVGGDLRAAGGDVRIASVVGRNATVAGGNVVLERDGWVRGNAYLAGGAVRLEGTVDALVRVAGGAVVVDGTVGGDVHAEAGELRIGPEAVIRGDVRYRLGRDEEIVIDPGASIGGRVIALQPRARRWPGGALRWLWLLGFVATAAAIVLLLPRRAFAGERALGTRPAASFALGFLGLLALPLLVAVAALTVVGLPFALILGALYLIALYLAPALTGIWLGGYLLGARRAPGRGRLLVALLLGAPLLVVVGFLPYGVVLWGLATVFGLGALWFAIRGRAPAAEEAEPTA